MKKHDWFKLRCDITTSDYIYVLQSAKIADPADSRLEHRAVATFEASVSMMVLKQTCCTTGSQCSQLNANI